MTFIQLHILFVISLKMNTLFIEEYGYIFTSYNIVKSQWLVNFWVPSNNK